MNDNSLACWINGIIRLVESMYKMQNSTGVREISHDTCSSGNQVRTGMSRDQDRNMKRKRSTIFEYGVEANMRVGRMELLISAGTMHINKQCRCNLSQHLSFCLVVNCIHLHSNVNFLIHSDDSEPFKPSVCL